jgi:hypothetical protein
MASATAPISSHSAVLRDVKGEVSADSVSARFCGFPKKIARIRVEGLVGFSHCFLFEFGGSFSGEQIGLKFPVRFVRAAARIGAVRPQVAAAGNRARAVRPLRAASAGTAAPVAHVSEEVPAAMDYEALAQELQGSSPLEVMDRALAMFGSEIAIAFRCAYTPRRVPILLHAPVTCWLVVDRCACCQRAWAHTRLLNFFKLHLTSVI